MENPWLPKSIILLRHHSRADFVADLLAGITVGLVALPLAMAFAISSGVTPQATVVTLILWRRFVPRVPGYIVALLGGTAAVACSAFL